MLPLPLLLAAGCCEGATILPLDGPRWTLANADGSTSVRAAVPGSIPLSLSAAGAAPDPYFGFSQGALNRTMSLETNWSYTTRFDFPSRGSGGAATELVARQLATVAVVSINGRFLGSSVDSQFEQRFPVPAALLKPLGNELAVHIGSSYLYAVAQAERAGVKCGNFLPVRRRYFLACNPPFPSLPSR